MTLTSTPTDALLTRRWHSAEWFGYMTLFAPGKDVTVELLSWADRHFLSSWLFQRFSCLKEKDVPSQPPFAQLASEMHAGLFMETRFLISLRWLLKSQSCSLYVFSSGSWFCSKLTGSNACAARVIRSDQVLKLSTDKIWIPYWCCHMPHWEMVSSTQECRPILSTSKFFFVVSC